MTAKEHEKTTLEVKTLDRKDTFDLKFRVLNAIVAPHEQAVITLPVAVEWGHSNLSPTPAINYLTGGVST